ncbi:MAG: cytochrome c peroxidase, partial [Pseudomonadota bacterium]
MKPFPWKTSLPFLVAILCLLPVYGPAWASDDELAKQAGQAFGSLPRIMASEKNPVTPEKVRLGQILFYETRISVDGTVSCSKCHLFNLYATDGL